MTASAVYGLINAQCFQYSPMSFYICTKSYLSILGGGTDTRCGEISTKCGGINTRCGGINTRRGGSEISIQ